jgi:hypothetical protein
MIFEKVEAAVEAEFVITATWWKQTLNAEHLRETFLIPHVITVNFNCWPNFFMAHCCRNFLSASRPWKKNVTWLPSDKPPPRCFDFGLVGYVIKV